MYKENDDIIVNLTITRRCYARCSGCINSTLTFAGEHAGSAGSTDCDPQRDALLVTKIAEHHPDRRLTLCFYGGEPFLATGIMEKVRLILNASPASRLISYMVYSTGELIGENIPLYPDLIRGIWLYSVSIDGGYEQHARVRPGTDLGRITDSLKKLRSLHHGLVLFWSTLREEQSLLDCFRQFMQMYRQGLVDHMFWHWADALTPFADIEGYAAGYLRDLEEIMNEYVKCLSAGELLPIAHINELVLYLHTGRKRGHTACSVELAQNYDVLDGAVHACADLPAHLEAVNRDGGVDIPAHKLSSLITYKQALGCQACSAHFYCGGRCPVQALAGSAVRTKQICRLMRAHVDLVKERLEEIRQQLHRHRVSLQKVYDTSAFITRYTDVVP